MKRLGSLLIIFILLPFLGNGEIVLRPSNDSSEKEIREGIDFLVFDGIVDQILLGDGGTDDLLSPLTISNFSIKPVYFLNLAADAFFFYFIKDSHSLYLLFCSLKIPF